MKLEQFCKVELIRKDLDKFPAFNIYHMCDNHIRAKKFSSTVPMLCVNIISASWDIEDDKNIYRFERL